MTRLFFTHNIKGHILLSCHLKLFPYPLAPPPILSKIFGEKMWPLLVLMVYDATRNTFQIVWASFQDMIRAEKTQVPLTRASKFWSWASQSTSLVVQWASKISPSVPVSVSESVSLINDNFKRGTITRLNTVQSTLPDNPGDSRVWTVSPGLQIRVWYLLDNHQRCYFL